MKRVLKFILLLQIAFLLLPKSIFANDSTKLEISVLTCARGDQIYTSFGHCAFRVKSLDGSTDKVYNYGCFNFRTPYFAIKFARGFLKYYLLVSSTSRFTNEYTVDKRKVIEQKLNLSNVEAMQMFDYLEWNALEENRYYKYNFLLDNCATRIRDCLRNIYGDKIVFGAIDCDSTLRALINERIPDMPWYRFGINILMGLPVDKMADNESAMFLPDYIYQVFNNSYIIRNGEKQPLVNQETVLIKAPQLVDRTTWTTYISPFLVFSLLLIVWCVATYFEIKKHKHFWFYDSILLFLTGLFGLLFIFMWGFTEHTVTAWNLNLLWAWPIHIVAVFMVRSKSRFWKTYFVVACLFTLLLAVVSPIITQHFDIAVYPLMAMLIMRMARIGFAEKLNKVEKIDTKECHED